MQHSLLGHPGSPSPPTNQEGPNEAPPQLPEGWLAQWEGQSRKYYYVQRATGHSQWEIPTQPALSVPTPDPTPQHNAGPFPVPSEANITKDGNEDTYEGADRSLLGDLAMNALGGGGHKPQKQSGFGGLASSFLGGQSSHGQGGSSNGGLAGQLVGSLLGSNKPQNQQQSAPPVSSSSHQSGGLIGMASGLLGSHHGSNQSNNFGYSSSGQGSSNAYSGQAPPVAYQPSNQTSHSYGPSSGEYRPPGQPQKPSNTANYQGSGSIPQYGPSSQSFQGVTPYGISSGGYDTAGQPQHSSNTGKTQGFSGVSQYVQSSPSSQGIPPYGQQGGFGQHEPSFSGGNGGQYGGMNTPAAVYSHQGSYNPSNQASYNPAFQGGSDNQYTSPPNISGYGSQVPSYQQSPQVLSQHNASYPQQSQHGGHDPYRPPPPINSHPNHQVNAGGYPGQQNYGVQGGQSGQGYGQTPPHGYGESYDSYGAPPAPGWRG